MRPESFSALKGPFGCPLVPAPNSSRFPVACDGWDLLK